MKGTKRWTVVTLAALAAVVLVSAPGSAAEEPRIDHVEARDGSLRILYSLPELASSAAADLDSTRANFNGSPLDAQAQLAASATPEQQVKRTAILAIDVSASMRGERIRQAKAAAQTYLTHAPVDLHVGVVAFAGTVELIHRPSVDRTAVLESIADLDLSPGTRLYDGLQAAVEVAGREGQRSILVLSDGRDTTDAPVDAAIEKIAETGVRVDVVALGSSGEANKPLEVMAAEGGGSVVAAREPEALSDLFSDEATALARQLLITADLPQELESDEGTLTVSVDVSGRTYTDEAFISIPQQAQAAARQGRETGQPTGTTETSRFASQTIMFMGVGGLGIGLLLIMMLALGVLSRGDTRPIQEQIGVYTRGGHRNVQASGHRAASGLASQKSLSESALTAAQRALNANNALESRLSDRLDGAGVALKPAEWLLAHAGMALGAGLVGFVLGSGSTLLMLLLLALGVVLPWLFLGVRKSRRLKAFNSQLPQTLQLVASSLSAGLSLAQSLDTVVREGSDPIAGEIRRALVEARLGVSVEDALESVAERMDSEDFSWVVMAIRIQREVGGNLGELLLRVAATMREREYLRRQVKSMSAEGRLSGWILGALPPGMLVYMMLVDPDYLDPMLTSPLGWMMLGVAVVLMAVGVFWMSRVVKVEV